MTTTSRGLLRVVALAVALAPTGVGAQERPELAWYGYLKLDASWDEALVNTGNFARWVISPDVFAPHQHFNMTARQTRLGFRVGTHAGTATLTGRWEADFYGGGAENKNALQVRHAYVSAVWPSGWELLAGQTSDVISPLNPSTLNYTVAWWAGNIGYRRPQLRATRRVAISAEGTLRFEGAISRTIGDDFVTVEPGDSGADSAVPTLQGLVGLELPMGGGPLGVGFYGHVGDENLHRELGGEDVDLRTQSVGAYLALPLGSALALSGEVWSGSNMDDFLGGVAQGVRVRGTGANAIDTHGGWAELSWTATGHLALHAGASRDDPEAEDLDEGARDLNEALWGTIAHDVGGGLRYGLEVSRWRTRYVGMLEGTSWRVQSSVIFSF